MPKTPRVYSYSLHIVELNKKADSKLLGVRLGRACIKHKVPVKKVVNELKVSRQTIYNWFCGDNTPQNLIAPKVEAFITRLG